MAKKVAKRGGIRKKTSREPKQLISKNRSKLALRNLILFAVLSLISFILYTVFGNQLYQDTFYLLTIIFIFVALAFLIIFLAISFSRGKVSKKR